MSEGDMNKITVDQLKQKPLFKQITFEWVAGLVKKYYPDVEYKKNVVGVKFLYPGSPLAQIKYDTPKQYESESEGMITHQPLKITIPQGKHYDSFIQIDDGQDDQIVDSSKKKNKKPKE